MSLLIPHFFSLTIRLEDVFNALNMRKSNIFRGLRSSSLFPQIVVLTVVSMGIFATPTLRAGSSPYANGNPFSNGSFFPDDGTFQTTLRGKNLSGVSEFSTGSAVGGVTAGGSGTFTVFYKGATFIGNTDGNIDPAGGTIAATMEASLPGSGQGNVSSVINSQFGLISREFVSGGTTSSTVSSSSSTTTPDLVTTISGGTTSVTNTDTTGAQTNTTSDTNTVTTGAQTNTDTTGAQTNTTQDTTYSASGTGNIDPVSGLPAAGSVAGTSTTGEQTNTTTTGEQTNTDTTTTTDTTGEQTNTSTTETTTPDQVTTVGGGTTTTETENTTSSTTPDQLTESYGLINTVADSSYYDVNYAAGAFSANLENSYPNQIFRGEGSMVFSGVDASSGVPQISSTEVDISVEGVRLADTATDYPEQTVETPYVFTTYDIQTS